MTVQMKELPETEADTLATRLRDAREALNLSRAEVAKRTGIPAKSIEKFEFGTQEPSVSRLLDLANVYGKSIDVLIGKEALANDSDPAPTTVSQFTQNQPAQIPAVTVKSADERVVDILNELDELRTVGFEQSYRTTVALIEDFKREIRYLEPDTLLELADARGLFPGECPNARGLCDLFTREPEKAQEFCGSVEERILDTAMLGVDLFGVEHSALSKIASELTKYSDGFEAPGIFWDNWPDDYPEFIPMIRDELRNIAIARRKELSESIENLPARNKA